MRLKEKLKNQLGALPLTLFYLFFLGAPLLMMAFISLFRKSLYGGITWTFTTSNYIRVFQPEILDVFKETILLAGTTALLAAVASFFISWFLSTRKNKWFLLGILILPFFTNTLIRIYALKSLQIAEGGPLVLIGMISTYLPFALLPIFNSFEKMDWSLVEAASDLGANSKNLLLKILWPLHRPAFLQGFVLVFVPCLGEYLIPDLLGGAKTLLLGNLLSEQFLRARDWPFGSAIAISGLLVLWLCQNFAKLISGRLKHA